MANYTYNNRHLIKDGEAFIPVMGEMHFSRYRADLWEESLRKMRAGGVSIVSTYVFWIHHEEIEGQFDWSGQRDLRRFLQTCKDLDIKVWLRVGPFAHGEARNGGIPDYIMKLAKEGMDMRSNDEQYMKYVRRYWTEMSKQTSGMMDKDGGPVIGIQIENEYGHVGGYTGEKGEAHMRALTALAKELGMVTDIYTATGWGGAVIGDCIPVMGGYCEAPWAQCITPLKANTNYIISHIRNDSLIASDSKVDDSLTFDQDSFPYLTAELGGGLQVTSHRRPIATGKDTGAMSLVKLASGANLLGYYMYHGGSNPEGKLSTLEENRAIGGYNDLPTINYDFNAPLRQYGGMSESFKEIKLLAMFLEEWGADLAPLDATIIPDDLKPEDMEHIRFSYRGDDNHGYVFYNNYQRMRQMNAHENVVFKVPLGDGSLDFPAIDVESGEYGFFPYNMKLGDTTLISAVATPLCSLREKDGSISYVFYADRDPQFKWEDASKAPKITLLSREDALNAYKATFADHDELIISEGFIWQDGQAVIETLYTDSESSMPFKKIGDFEYEIDITYPADLDISKNRLDGNDMILEFDWTGFSMDVYAGDKKVNDYYYTSQKDLLSLGYLGYPTKLSCKITPLHKDDYVFLEKWPDFDGSIGVMNNVAVKCVVRKAHES